MRPSDVKARVQFARPTDAGVRCTDGRRATLFRSVGSLRGLCVCSRCGADRGVREGGGVFAVARAVTTRHERGAGSLDGGGVVTRRCSSEAGVLLTELLRLLLAPVLLPPACRVPPRASVAMRERFARGNARCGCLGEALRDDAGDIAGVAATDAGLVCGRPDERDGSRLRGHSLAGERKHCPVRLCTKQARPSLPTDIRQSFGLSPGDAVSAKSSSPPLAMGVETSAAPSIALCKSAKFLPGRSGVNKGAAAPVVAFICCSGAPLACPRAG